MVAVLGDDEDGNVCAAVERGGGRPGAVADARALIWSGGDVEDLAGALEQASGITWVQLPSAGIESFRPVVQRWPDLTWTCAKEIYGAPVAEQALALLLALRRGLPEFARAGRWSPEVLSEPLLGSGDVVTILGGGGIAVSLARLLAPLGVHVRVQRRSVAAGFDGPHAELFGEDQLAAALDGARALVVTLPLTDATRGLLGAPELRRLARGAVVLTSAGGRCSTPPGSRRCWRTGRYAVWGWTSPIPSRCRTTARCGATPPAWSPPTPRTRRQPGSLPSPGW